MNIIEKDEEGWIFLDAPGGTEKLFTKFNISRD